LTHVLDERKINVIKLGPSAICNTRGDDVGTGAREVLALGFTTLENLNVLFPVCHLGKLQVVLLCGTARMLVILGTILRARNVNKSLFKYKVEEYKTCFWRYVSTSTHSS
jgi:hypothetical protein